MFTSTADSAVASSDYIRDFANGDLIDLSGIDARAGTGTDDAFVLVSASSGAAGELIVSRTNGGYAVAGDVNGDGTADFRILLIGSGPLNASDSVL